MRTERSLTDPGLLEHYVQLRGRTVALEAPRVLLLTVALIILFDAGYAAVGLVMPASYYFSDLLQSVVLLAGAVLLRRNLVHNKYAPAIFMVAVAANNAATTYQATMVGEGAMGVVALLLAVAGAVVLSARAYVIGALWCIFYTGIMLYLELPDVWVTWSITMATAAAVGGMVLYGRTRSMMNLARAQQTIERMATVDQLTGLLNRHGLHEQTHIAVGQARRTGQELFVVFADVAGLKQVNNEFGHAAGDLVLSRVAAAIRDVSRTEDLVCRWGGDEFVIIGVGERPLPEIMRERTLETLDVRGLDHLWTPGLWVGSAAAPPSTELLDQLIEAADRDMLMRREHSNPVPEQAPVPVR